MNREIKFRAWDKENEIMLKWNRHIKKSFYEFIAHSQFIVMQYTGLADKRGREIYAGDIVKNSNDELLFIAGSNDKAGLSIYDSVTGERGILDKNNAEIVEIVGNKFKDSELLQE